MAADVTGVRVASVTLTASTAKTIRLTGRSSDLIELVHWNNVDNPVSYRWATNEAGLGTNGVAGLEMSTLLPGERLQVRVKLGATVWVRLISEGAARVTVDGGDV